MIKLGVNIDHVATVRQARKGSEPDPVWAAAAAELGGADQITVHLREDRRHIQDRDIHILSETVNVNLNFECACVTEMIDLACKIKPQQVCLVPEKREEVTTEGGLDLVSNRDRIGQVIERLNEQGIFVSLFLDPDLKQIDMAKELNAAAVELHTGSYANAKSQTEQQLQLDILTTASDRIVNHQLHLHAGHGLTYTNVTPVTKIPAMEELNIGHCIISRAIFVGLSQAVREMKQLVTV